MPAIASITQSGLSRHRRRTITQTILIAAQLAAAAILVAILSLSQAEPQDGALPGPVSLSEASKAM